VLEPVASRRRLRPQSRVDEARIEVVVDTLRQLGLPPGRAKTLAVMAVASSRDAAARRATTRR